VGLDDCLSRADYDLKQGLGRCTGAPGDRKEKWTMQALFATARIALGTLALVFLLALALPALAQQNAPVDPQASVQSEETLLRQFPRIEGDIDQPNPRERVLIQPDGRIWDHFHEVTLHWTSIVVILGMVAVLAAAYLITGRMRISAGRSGTKVHRFSGFERFAHWLTASSFVVLGLTGLNITFGKHLLLPVIGPDAFSDFAQIAKYVHNYVSFAFVLGLVLIVSMWMKDNIPRKIDIVWLKEGGGFIRSKHPTAGRFNAGEKLVFWFALGAGAAVAVSGYLLMFPFYVTNIAGMQLAQVVHSLTAVAFIAVIIAHIYIGTLGMEGAFEAMGTGSVDLNWAKEHHGLWLAEEIAKGRVPNHQQAAATPAE
jgi:formate dehydrogenase subunit gamma